MARSPPLSVPPRGRGVDGPPHPARLGRVRPLRPAPLGCVRPLRPAPLGCVRPLRPAPLGCVRPLRPAPLGCVRPLRPAPLGDIFTAIAGKMSPKAGVSKGMVAPGRAGGPAPGCGEGGPGVDPTSPGRHRCGRRPLVPACRGGRCRRLGRKSGSGRGGRPFGWSASIAPNTAGGVIRDTVGGKNVQVRAVVAAGERGIVDKLGWARCAGRLNFANPAWRTHIGPEWTRTGLGRRVPSVAPLTPRRAATRRRITPTGVFFVPAPTRATTFSSRSGQVRA
jgi:hypothetical protein